MPAIQQSFCDPAGQNYFSLIVHLPSRFLRLVPPPSPSITGTYPSLFAATIRVKIPAHRFQSDRYIGATSRKRRLAPAGNTHNAPALPPIPTDSYCVSFLIGAVNLCQPPRKKHDVKPLIILQTIVFAITATLDVSTTFCAAYVSAVTVV